jgi:endonuclease/exonuclease/phosphatase family metal-dependent hydrolase
MPASRHRGSDDVPTVCFRVMTYNVHRCRGLDRAWSPERIAAVIASTHPDIVALQELDVGRARSGHVDQAETIARDLGMDVQFFPALRVMEELYGDAILSRWPAKTVKAAALPGLRLPGLEPRGALWSRIQVDGATVQVINTHLSILGRERLLQIKALTGPEWLRHPDCRGPVLGDLNATPRSKTYRQVSSHLADAFLASRKPRRSHVPDALSDPSAGLHFQRSLRADSGRADIAHTARLSGFRSSGRGCGRSGARPALRPCGN